MEQFIRSSSMFQGLDVSSFPSACIAIACGAFVLLVFNSKRESKDFSVPLVSNANGDFKAILSEGHEKFRHELFKIPTSNSPMVILPTSFLDEIKALPEKTLSFRREMYDRFLGKYTAFASNDDPMVKSIKVDLTKAIDTILPVLEEEAQFAIKDCFSGAKDDWTPFPLHTTSTRMIAMLSGRIFVGLPLSRSEEWIYTTISTTINSMNGAGKMWSYPAWTRPFIQYFIPELRGVTRYRNATRKMLKPLLDQRLRDMQDSDFERPADMLQWIIQNSKEKRNDLGFHTTQHLVLNIAAIHTTGGQLSNTLYELAARPEYLGPLREEIENTIQEDGRITKMSLYKLRKMDSFFREVQRVNPPGLVSTNRKVLRPLTLSNGLTLPVGTSIAVSAACVSKDPSIWENPDEFDGFRFEKLRKEDADENRYQFTSVSADALSFGKIPYFNIQLSIPNVK